MTSRLDRSDRRTRLDGPEGGDTPPPGWATPELLADAIRTAAGLVRVDGPSVNGRTHTFAFGRQLDVRTIRGAAFDGGTELTERAVAAYIAKYATKGAEAATGTLDRPLRFLAELAHLRIAEHARRMIRTAWTLGARARDHRAVSPPARRRAAHHLPSKKRAFGRIRKLPSERFQARYLGPDGVDRPAPHTFATKTDADNWLADRQSECGPGAGGTRTPGP